MAMTKDNTSEDDQVSLVLEHFQPEAAFQSRGSSNNRKKKSSSFASVRYHADTQTLRLIYLYPSQKMAAPLRLEFHVNVKKPHLIQFVSDKYSSEGAATDEKIQLVCDQISSNTTNTTLFWVVSKLLLELENLQLSRPKVPTGHPNHLVKRLYSNRRTCWDLPLFLMRCATTSKKSSKVCTLPDSFGRQSKHAAISLLHIRDNLLPHYEKIQSTADENSLIAFLASLQWTEHVQISTDNNVSQLSTIHNSREQGNITPQATEQNNQTNAIRVTLDLTKGARDPTPRFVQGAQTRGTIKAFHGTAFENVWSILTFGLQTHPTLQINGALMGAAVYLSDMYALAYFYATKDGNGTKCLPRPHWYSSPAFWNVLVGRGQQNDKNGWSKVPAFVREVVQNQKNQQCLNKDWEMDVTCYAVVECSIIQPPPKSSDNQLDKTTVMLDDKLRSATKHQGHIYAVPDPNDSIHMEKVHLTFEFSRRRKLSSLLGVGERTMMGIGVVAVILFLLILRQHS